MHDYSCSNQNYYSHFQKYVEITTDIPQVTLYFYLLVELNIGINML